MKLQYFDIPGRGEAIRILLHAAGADYTDERIKFSDWPSIKPTTPLGSVPVLTIDDTDFCQSIALARYAGKLSGFFPEDPLKALIVDETLDTLDEMMTKTPGGSTDEEKKANRKEFQETTMKKYFSFIDSRIQKFGGGTTVCGTASVADIQLMILVDQLQAGFWDFIDTDFPESYPNVMACAKAIKDHEKVKSYYDSLKK